MPKSPREHVIERESHAAFELLLGDRFVYRRENPDYRIDGVVEQIDGEDVTGLRFYVQLKATDEEDLSKALAISLPLADREYYRSLSLPVLMVRYHAPTKSFYLRWVSEYDPYYGRGGNKTFTFRWQPQDAWGEARADELIAEARVFRELHSPGPPLPRPLHVQGEAFGLNETELLYAFRAAADGCDDVIDVRSGMPAEGAASITVSDDELAVNLSKVSGAVLHLPEGYESGEVGENMANDGLLMVAAAYANVGQLDIAARLVVAVAPRSGIVGDPSIAMALQGILAGARRVRESLELAKELDLSEDKADREASILFTLPALEYAERLSKGEADLHKKILRSRVSRRKRDGEDEAASRELVNLANFHRRRGEGRKAISRYHEAAVLDPAYEQRAYYWHELGGVLWMDRRYEDAAKAYRRALELGAEPIAQALYADSLMFAGQYAEARDLFAAFNEAHPDIADEYRLKKLSLDVIVDGLGLSVQKRDLDAAMKACPRINDGTPADQVVAGSERQLRSDALWPSAWFNIGIAEARRANQSKALLAFIGGTILMPEVDLDPWTHAIVYAWQLQEKDLLRDMLTTSYRRAGPAMLRELVKHARAQDTSFPRDEMLREVDAVLADSPSRHASRYTIRLLGSDGVEEVHVDGASPD